MAVRTKAGTDAALHPVKTLKENIVALDAAMLVAVTGAGGGAVHKLRTGTRRVEAHMRMLDVLGGAAHPAKIAVHANEVKAVNRRLRRVRRAAGAVRDLDVQNEIIRYDMPAKTAVHTGTPGDAVRKQGKELRKHLQARRKEEASDLIATLKTEEQKLAASLHALEQVLKPASQPAVSPEEVQQRIQAWFTQETTSLLYPRKHGDKGKDDDLRAAIERMSDRALHALRKSAKQCRYMAESAPEDAALRQTAERYEAVQEAGGKWHDWLLLVQLSRRFHGHKAELTQRFRRHRDASLGEYRLSLAILLPVLMG